MYLPYVCSDFRRWLLRLFTRELLRGIKPRPKQRRVNVNDGLLSMPQWGPIRVFNLTRQNDLHVDDWERWVSMYARNRQQQRGMALKEEYFYLYMKEHDFECLPHGAVVRRVDGSTEASPLP